MEFAATHVDILKNVTFTRPQLGRRWARELRRKYSIQVQDDLRDFSEELADLDSETFPGYEQTAQLLAQFKQDKKELYKRRLADEVKNELLIAAIAYETAAAELPRIELSISGRQAVEEIQEEIDPLTLEVLQEAVAGLEGLEPLAETVLSQNEEGEEIEIPNPAKYAPETGAIARRDAALAVIQTTSAEVLDIVTARSVVRDVE